MPDSIILDSEASTISYGRDYAGQLRRGDVVALCGELGAGKTHLSKGIAAGLGAKEEGVTLDFQDQLTAGEIEDAADDFAAAIRGVDPRITRVFVRSGRAKAAYAQPLAT